MFKQMSVAFLFCLTSTIANAQSSKYFETVKSVPCDDARLIIKGLMERYGEVPVWGAKDLRDESRYLLTVNEKNGSWTLLQYTPELACILGAGTESNLATDRKNSM